MKAAGGDRFQSVDGLVARAGQGEALGAYYPTQMIGLRCAGACADGYPHDLRSWKQTFGFAARAPGETLDAYRERAHVAVYYNENELGLGREMGCASFTTASHGLEGKACWVTNYGQTFNDRAAALRDAVEGVRAKNTVCIVYNPELPPERRINFWVFGGAERGDDGAVAASAQLDYMGARAVPQICTSCHGGTYDPALHLVHDGRFLPANVLELGFPEAPDRDAQAERFRVIAEIALATPLTPSQIDFIDGMFGGQVHTPGQPIAPWVPAAFRVDFPAADGTVHRASELYRLVLAPHCIGCHNALEGEPGVRALADPRDLIDDGGVVEQICDRQGRAASGAGSDAQWGQAQPALAAACGHCHTWHLERDAVDDEAGMVHDYVARGVMPRPPYRLSPAQRAAILEYTVPAKVGAPTWGYGYTMPNAQPTQRRFWERPVVDDRGVRHPSAKSYLLGFWLAGLNPRCGPLGCDCAASACDAPNPRTGATGDALCGDAVSGTLCDGATGRCLDESNRTGGACAPLSGRTCPAHEECSGSAIGACLKCGRPGEAPCPNAGCEARLVAAKGVCGGEGG
jgi:mono/diheme cytochrome c family protein